MEIPTKKLVIEEEEIVVRSYLTQQQEDEYNSLLLGDQDIDVSDSGSNDGISMRFKTSQLASARKFLIESLCVDLTWEEYNTRSPQFRQELFKQLGEIQNPKKKLFGK